MSDALDHAAQARDHHARVCAELILDGRPKEAHQHAQEYRRAADIVMRLRMEMTA